MTTKRGAKGCEEEAGSHRKRNRGEMPFNARSFLVSVGRAYVQHSSATSFLTRQFITRACRIIGHGKVDICLDVGAGVTPYKRVLAQQLQYGYYIAMDIEPTEHTQLVGNAECLPIASNSVDVLVSFEVIQHLSNPSAFLAECWRCLVPGGHIMVTFPFLYPECDVHDFHRWTLEGMKREIERSGMEVLLVDRRGGAFFALASGLNWVIQHVVPGQRRRWHVTKSISDIVRSLFVQVLTIPTQLLRWLALPIDRLIPSKGYYMGGVILARKA